MASSGHHFSVYDSELDKRFSYTLPQPFDASAQKPYWMDGHRIISNSGGKVVVFDYDGINIQTLVDSDPAALAIFDRDYTEIYTITSSGAQSGKTGFFSTQLRLDGDK